MSVKSTFLHFDFSFCFSNRHHRKTLWWYCGTMML